MTPKKLSPIHDVAAQAGAATAEKAGWLVPQRYAGAPIDLTSGVGLVDESHYGKIMIDGHDADRVLTAAGLAAPGGIGEGVISESLAAYRLRPDQIFIMTVPGARADIMASLSSAAVEGEHVTITDITHGRAQLRLVGPEAAVMLGRACPLDLRPDVFPDGTARQSSVAKTTQLVIRHDLNDGQLTSYVIIGARSLGAYLWTTFIGLGRDLGVRPLGTDDYLAWGG